MRRVSLVFTACASAALLLPGCARTASEYFEQALAARAIAEQEELLSRSLDADPDFQRARFLRIRVYTARQKYKEALADCDYLRERTKDFRTLARTFYERGVVLETMGRNAAAAESYTAALRCDSTFVTAYSARASANFKMGRYAECIDDCQAVLRREGTSPVDDSELQLRIGFAASCIGDWKLAEEAFRIAADKSPLPFRKARALLNWYLVQCRLNAKDKADPIIRQYAQNILEDHALRRAAISWFYTIIRYCAGQVDEKQLLETCKNANPQVEADQTATAHYYIGALGLVLGNRNKAMESFRICTNRVAFDSAEYHLARVELDRLLSGGMTAGDYVARAHQAATDAERLDLYAKALEIDPKHTGALLGRAIVNSQLGNSKEALQDYTALLDLYKNPGDRAKALLYRGITHAQTGDYAAALQDYEAATEADPSLWTAHEQRATAQCRLRRYRDAAATYSTLLADETADPARKAVWQVCRAYALRCAGDLDAAAKDLRAVLKIRLNKDDESLIRTHLSIIDSKLGRKDEAAKELRDYARNIKIASWEGQIAWHVAGMLTDAKLLSASEHSDKTEQLLRTSRSWYYIGMVHLLHNDDKGKAIEAFEQCIRIGAQTRQETWEHQMALAELAAK